MTSPRILHDALRLSVAPMMDWTDTHCRVFHRLLAPNARLYTEMVHAQAVIHGDRDRLLGFDTVEHPVALQLGGSEPARLAQAARIAQEWGYDEVNLNVGCPSDRVQAGRFGACLMKEPALVAECVAAMIDAVDIPVTVKCRLGVDEQEDYDLFRAFIDTVAATGCKVACSAADCKACPTSCETVAVAKPARSIETTDAARLVSAYRQACVEGRNEDAIRLAMQALSRDPNCFADPK